MNYFSMVAFVCTLRAKAEDSSGPDGIFDIVDAFMKAENEALKEQIEELKAKDESFDAFKEQLEAENEALKEQIEALKAKDESLSSFFHHVLDEVNNLKEKTRLRRIPNRGEPGASSYFHDNNSPQKAFSNLGSYWSSENNQFPAQIYTKLERNYSLAKIAASIVYTQGNLEIVGSDDCINWTPLRTVENPGVTSRYQYKEWDIPAHENGWRDSFSCFGLQWEEKTEEHAYPKGTGYVGVGGISMWEEI